MPIRTRRLSITDRACAKQAARPSAALRKPSRRERPRAMERACRRDSSRVRAACTRTRPRSAKAAAFSRWGSRRHNAVAETGQAYSYQPYAQPFYSGGDATSSYQFIPWGGPPAFDPDANGMGERDGLAAINGVDSFGDPYFLGVGEGITAFDGVTPSSGAYKLSVAISTIGNGGSVIDVVDQQDGDSINASRRAAHADGSGIRAGRQRRRHVHGFAARRCHGSVRADRRFRTGRRPERRRRRKREQTARSARHAIRAGVLHACTSRLPAAYSLPDANGPNSGDVGRQNEYHSRARRFALPRRTRPQAARRQTATTSSSRSIGFDYPIYQAALGLTQEDDAAESADRECIGTGRHHDLASGGTGQRRDKRARTAASPAASVRRSIHAIAASLLRTRNGARPIPRARDVIAVIRRPDRAISATDIGSPRQRTGARFRFCIRRRE